MKPYLSFLLVPTLALGGWALSLAMRPAAPIALPQLPELAAPPALGVVVPPPTSQGPTRVRLETLLPPSSRKLAGGAPAVAPTLPTVTAVLIDGSRRVAQVDGRALTVGEQLGHFRVAAIESGRVQFEHPALRDKRWVSVSER